jgi:hypothetical protein
MRDERLRHIRPVVDPDHAALHEFATLGRGGGQVLPAAKVEHDALAVRTLEQEGLARNVELT